MAAGGAFYFLNEADIVICSEDAQFFDPHVSYGLVAAVEPIGALRSVPYQDVMRMALMGSDERISAQTALRISMVTEVVPREDLFARADAIAARLAGKPAVVIQGTVKAIWESADIPRTVAVRNSLKFTQMGNPLGRAAMGHSGIEKVKWTER
jgi:enoyl-CoA hydratase/carnithine racemase